MESHAKAVVIGGGVVGCSILFHLAKFGWKDVVLLERNELTSGSSWHAAGQIHTISSDPNISRLQGYTINLYKEIEETSGHSIGMHATGGFYLASNQTWYDYLKRERSKARYMGLNQEFISVKEAAERHPLIDPKHYLAALWDDLDGDIDPSGVTYAFAKSAEVHGAKYYTHSPVIETNQRTNGSWDVVTPNGTINAEMIVNCGGLWAREVGPLSGIDVPVQSMEHHYLITEEIAEIKSRDPENRLPAGIDYEGNIYFRQEQQGMLLGTYEPSATPWKISGTPDDFGHDLLPPDLDRISDRLNMSFERIPALAEAGIKDVSIEVSEDGENSRLVLKSASSGYSYRIDFTDSADSFLSGLEVSNNSQMSGSSGGFITNVGTGVTDSLLNSNFEVNGLTFYRDSNNVTDALTGVTLDLLNTFTTPQTVTVSADVDGVQKEVQDFLDAFNDSVNYLRSNAGMNPSTKERGILADDGLYRNMTGDLRSKLQTIVSDVASATYDRLYDLGIESDTTGHYSIVDSSKFEMALDSNTKNVSDIFNATDGIATVVKTYVNAFVKVGGSIDSSKNTLQDSIFQLDTRITYWDEVLAKREIQLRDEFTRIQTMMSQLSQQQSFLNNFK